MQRTMESSNRAFVGKLTHYIISHHPDRIEDVEFIRERADAAASAFEQASINGMSVDEAMTEAETVLYHNLIFSPYLTVKEVILEEMDYTEDDDELDEFTMQMLELTQPAFGGRELDDNFQGSDDYPVLRNEIKEMINQYLVKNGIQ